MHRTDRIFGLRNQRFLGIRCGKNGINMMAATKFLSMQDLFTL
jgi:hypothetical protein